jgi:phosphodiesterase/alkaline phosphatase D-like protein
MAHAIVAPIIDDGSDLPHDITVLPCKTIWWHIKVKVKSIHPGFWPHGKIKIQLVEAGPHVDRKDTTRMVSATSASVNFTGRDSKTYTVTAILPTELAEWELIEDEAVTIQKGEEKHVILRVRLKVNVFLKLVYKDPEGNDRLFPKNMPVEVEFGQGPTKTRKIKANGHLEFEAHPDQRYFSLRFGMGTVHYIRSKAGAAGADTESLKDQPGAEKKAIKKGARYFRLPPDWRLKNAIWAVTGGGAGGAHYDGGNYRFDVGAYHIGADAARVQLQLDPKWQFLRFEYFDRFYGHGGAGHNEERVSIPAIGIEGFAVRMGQEGAVPDPDTHSNWMVQTASRLGACHALPWILQRRDNLSNNLQPKPGCLLQFTQPANTYVYSETVDKRELKEVTGKELRARGKRLKYYDLPVLWKSQGYYTRAVGGANCVFEDVLEPRLRQSQNAHADKLTFSLDDLVLTDEALKPIPYTAGERVAVFHHKFGAEAQTATDANACLGIFDPDAGNHFPFYSYRPTTLNARARLYLWDYADWSRLVIFNGNMYDAFAERTPDRDGHATVGARAAVRWVDAIDVTVAAGEKLSRRPAPISKDFFSIQPFFEQRYAATTAKYKGPATADTGIGRFDMVLLRCCDREGDGADPHEVMTCMKYFRLDFDFGRTAPAIQNVTYTSTFVGPLPGTVSMSLSWATDIRCRQGNGDVDANGHADGTIKTQHSLTVNPPPAAGAVTAVTIVARDPMGSERTQTFNITAADAVNANLAGNAPGPAADTPTLAVAPAADQFIAASSMNIIARLNGDDANNSSRLQLLARRKAIHRKANIFWLIHPAPTERAHYTMQVYEAAHKRPAFMGSYLGNGAISINATQPETLPSPAFAAVHELGHGSSLPDEYNERWNNNSFDEQGIVCNTPGDPFEPDGRSEPTDGFAYTSAGNASSLMDGMVEMRNRYGWQVAEWARLLTKTSYYVRHQQGANYNKYRIPPHDAAPKRNHVYWPIAEAIDIDPNFNMSAPGTFRTPDSELHITTAPTVPVPTLTSGEARIEWQTDLASDSTVEFGTVTGTYTGSKKVGELVTDHKLDVTGLTAATQYFYRVRSTDARGTQAVSAEGTFTTIADTRFEFTVNPATPKVTRTTSRITCSTDKSTTVEIEYGPTATYGTTTPASSSHTDHSRKLTGLIPGTLYHYRVKATRHGRIRYSEDATFETRADLAITVAPAISAPDLTATSATFKWTTNVPADTQWKYALENEALGAVQTDAGLVKQHVVVLTKLIPGAKYKIEFQSSAAGVDSGWQPAIVFTMNGGKGPAISNCRASKVTRDGATIEWVTDDAADSEVEWGETAAYGNLVTRNPALDLSHSMAISGLTPGKQYHYRVRSKNSAERLAISDDFTFTTGGGSSISITNDKAEPLSATTATIVWDTDIASDSQVEWTPAAGGASQKTALKTETVTAHSVDITGLTAATDYRFTVRSRAADGTLATGPERTFTTPNITVSNHRETMRGTSAHILFDTAPNATAKVEYGTTTAYGTTSSESAAAASHDIRLSGLTPGTEYHYRVIAKIGVNEVTVTDRTFRTARGNPIVISDVQTTQLSPTSVKVTWKTDGDGNSRVEYSVGPPDDSDGSLDYGKYQNDGAFVRDHSVVLTGLKVSETYHFRVGSTRPTGEDRVFSGNSTFRTIDSTAPCIYDVTATAVDATTMNITWTTDRNADTEVEYGTDPSFGQTTGVTDTPAGALNHAQTLQNLTPGTKYYYRVKSKVTGGDGKLNLLLYPAGKERYSEALATPHPIDGIIVGMTKFAITHYARTKALMQPDVIKIRSFIREKYNQWLAEGTARPGSRQEWKMEASHLMFSPHLVVTNSPDALDLSTPAGRAQQSVHSTKINGLIRNAGIHQRVFIEYKKKLAGAAITVGNPTSIQHNSHQLVTGDFIEITNAPAVPWNDLNGYWRVTRVDDNNFQLVGHDSTGRAVYPGGAVYQTHHNRKSIAGGPAAGSSRLTVANHGRKSGDSVLLNATGGPPGWNATFAFVRVTVVDANQLDISQDVSGYPGTYLPAGGARVGLEPRYIAITDATQGNPTVLKSESNGLRTGDNVFAYLKNWGGINSGGDVTIVSEDEFSIPQDSTTAVGPIPKSSYVILNAPVPVTDWVSATTGNLTLIGHGFANGDEVTIAGAPAIAGINGKHTVTRKTDDEFTIPISVAALGNDAYILLEGLELVVDLDIADAGRRAKFKIDVWNLYAKLLGFTTHPAAADPGSLGPLVQRVIPDGKLK